MSGKYVILDINGRSMTVIDAPMSYEQIVGLARCDGHPSVMYATKRNGDQRRTGTMYTGCAPVALEDGMVFTVVHTGNA